jgi:sialate O-acetylesterase
LITDWRTRWGEGDFPFLFVQLAGFEDREPDWPLLRESQLKTLSVAKTGMAVAVDIGDPKNIHPTDKVDVGHRLALAAEHVAYGQDVVYSGPIYDSMKTERNTLRVSFTQTGGGLVIGAAPWLAVGVTPLPSDKLAGFLIAGEDKNWVEADAKIDGTTVVVSSPQVAQPVAVRYGWADAPRVNLYNKESLPASPFRTDEWDDHPQPPLK